MNREKIMEMKDDYFASMQAFFAEHEGTDLEDADGLWGFLAVSALHHACCQELQFAPAKNRDRQSILIEEALKRARKLSKTTSMNLDEDVWTIISSLELALIEGGAS